MPIKRPQKLPDFEHCVLGVIKTNAEFFEKPHWREILKGFKQQHIPSSKSWSRRAMITSLRLLIVNAEDMIAKLQALDEKAIHILDDEEVREQD